jgi:hypothetical protein
VHTLHLPVGMSRYDPIWQSIHETLDEQLLHPSIEVEQALHFCGVTDTSMYAPSLHFKHALTLHYKQNKSVSLHPLHI